MSKKSWIRNLWERWKTFARVIGNINSRIILTLFYFIVVGLVSLLVGRWQNYLRTRQPKATNWLPVSSQTMDLPEAKQQF
jgi:hypothetical protein